ncbi:hypothetical protein PYW07_003227 [Mythimna separata]|uniref:Uncharacterized protein n=1 Tax=Mythimna separata TaxID=271217 RepID=A0AAD7YIT0_MYTSE|nr:hypothetical protein PYW07_003227 [Mythimna separata]
MSKSSEVQSDEYNFCPSVFTLTFAIEVVGSDVRHDCKAGWVELGPPNQGVRLSYQLYPGNNFDIDVVIWPHVAKVLCGADYGWVRTWQFLESRWLTFSIQHAVTVKVTDLRNFVVTVNPNFGMGALNAHSKIIHTAKVLLPPLRFGERRQFAEVRESECPLYKYVDDMIWSPVANHISTTSFLGPFDTPLRVEDIRHQDAALYEVRNIILGRTKKKNDEEEEKENQKSSVHTNCSRVSTARGLKAKLSKETAKKENIEKKREYDIKLSGDWILAGIGRVIPFVISEDSPKEHGEVIALISSINLPSDYDFSIFFVNVGNLTDIPIEHLKLHRFTHIYTRWTISGEQHDSELEPLQRKQLITEINFNDHHAVPLPSAMVSYVMGTFHDGPFQLELRGVRTPPLVIPKRTFFGHEKTDYNYIKRVPPPIPKHDTDILIAQTRIDARALTKINGSVKGEFPLYPPETSVKSVEHEAICTNDVNAVRAKLKPDLIIQPGVILEAQMTIEVSLGLVGCIPKTKAIRYSRMFCRVNDSDTVMSLIRKITEINELVTRKKRKAGLLTGFALDTGDTVMLYVEGPKQGHILRLWEKTEEFYPTVKPVFSTSARYSYRLYPDLLVAPMPFYVMKMVVPLSVLLGVTPVYAGPALPLPTRSAVLKIGRLIASKLESAPGSRVMPTSSELESFRLELCVPPRPASVFDHTTEFCTIYDSLEQQVE